MDCNLLSPWFDGALDVVRPLINSGRLEMLGHVLALRRPKLAAFLYGIVACGATETIKSVIPFLENVYNQNLSQYAPEVAAWMRSPQSFVDLGGSGPYIQKRKKASKKVVSRADVWRLRHENASGQGSTPLSCPWPPFGSIPVYEVDLPVRAHLGCSRHFWEYSRWTWFLDDRNVDITPLGDSGSEDEGSWTTRLDSILPPSQQDMSLYYPNSAASRAAVRAAFQWSAIQMEPSGRHIYTHPWVDPLGYLSFTSAEPNGSGENGPST